ncbi:hypothetical protein DFP72DRAFT_881820 [Ephemerocybe angulata]|uniref:BTB domain-containing protein n=1 Tax=Ephemerocybe angulata TaxID=980116 RepID=A0A8H6I9A2_9AGAR|nr:hypothetical protein DFP72DRAFT_881820 [Tulosesus angulatus]
MAEQIMPPGSRSAPHRVEEYYWRTVVFKVGDGLFRVPRGQFIAQSEVFAGMFAVPSPAENGNVSVEGESDENPIVLEGYEEKDFKALLGVLYPSMFILTRRQHFVDQAELTSVLKLSTRWEMHEVRRYAITQLSGRSGLRSLTPVEKIALARAHWVSDWLIEGLVDLVNDNPKLTPDELEASVGLRTAFRIARLKLERNLSSAAGTYCYTCGRNSGTRLSTEPISGELVRETFKDEIDEMVEAERPYGLVNTPMVVSSRGAVNRIAVRIQ